MNPEEIHQLAIEIYEALKWEGAELKDTAVSVIENLMEEFLHQPKYWVGGCGKVAYVEGWLKGDSIYLKKVPVCREHMHLLIGKEITE